MKALLSKGRVYFEREAQRRPPSPTTESLNEENLRFMEYKRGQKLRVTCAS